MAKFKVRTAEDADIILTAEEMVKDDQTGELRFLDGSMVVGSFVNYRYAFRVDEEEQASE